MICSSNRWALLAALCLFWAPVSVASEGTAEGVRGNAYLVLVSGLGGDERFVDSFFETSILLYDAAVSGGLDASAIHFLAEDPERDQERIDARSTRENVGAALAEVRAASQEGDTVWIVLVGHGSHRDGSSRINLPGPDLSDVDFNKEIETLAGRKIVFVNTSSSSGGFVKTLSGADRIVITATKSAAQRNETRFGPLFAKAFADGDADEDLNGQVSVLEAFRYASREVARHYETEKLLATEQALLDDNGDHEGSAEPESLGGESGMGDGRFASLVHLASAGAGSGDAASDDLAARRATLMSRLDDLRRQKGALSRELYDQELQRLLVEIARIDRQLPDPEATPESDSR